MDSELDHLYQQYLKFHTDRISEGNDPMAIAAILITQALSIYKTAMTAEEFDQMVDAISDSRNSIKTFNGDITIQ